jgi:hypothetical protein
MYEDLAVIGPESLKSGISLTTMCAVFCPMQLYITRTLQCEALHLETADQALELGILSSLE